MPSSPGLDEVRGKIELQDEGVEVPGVAVEARAQIVKHGPHHLHDHIVRDGVQLGREEVDSYVGVVEQD